MSPERLNTRPDQSLAERPLAQRPEGAAGARSIPRRLESAPAPLSFAQQRLWFLHELFPQSVAYNVPSAYRLVGSLDAGCLQQALGEIVRRHEVLRTTFTNGDQGEPVQRVHEPVPVELPVTPVDGGSRSERLERVRELARERVRRPFDLRRGPLLCAELFRLAGDDHVLLLWFHHVIADLWSLGILFEEFQTLYGAFLRGVVSALPQPPVQYADFAVWQRERLAAGMLDEHLPYWRQQLAGLQPLALPTDRPRSAVQDFAGAHLRTLLPGSVVGRLAALARKHDATPFMAVAAGFAALLARHCNQHDVAVGIAAANRTHPELEQLVGFFVNMLVLRTDLSGDPSFAELVARVRESTLGAYEHQEVPFEKLVEMLLPDRDLSQGPLVNIVLSYFNAPGEGLRLPGTTASELVFDPGIAKLDIDVAFAVTGSGLRVDVEYRTDLFEQATIERLFAHFARLLGAAVEDPALRLAELPLAGPAEIRQLLAWSETPPLAAPPRRNVHELFEEQAAARTGEVAVICGERLLRFGELNRRANRLADHLRQLGVGPEVIVAVCTSRSLEAVVAFLGVLKAGGAYLPLDPDVPRERLASVLADARARVLLAPGELLARLPAHSRVVCLEEELATCSPQDPTPCAGPQSLAYTIYTSGSTGKPKGVMVEHASLVDLCWWARHRLGLGPGEIVSWAGSPAFDVSMLELWPNLLAGGSVEILEDAKQESGELQSWLVERGVTVTIFVAAVTEGLLGLDWPQAGRLRLMVTGADRLRARPQAGSPFELLNTYGPTETTVVASLGSVSEEGDRLPGIGQPIWSRRMYVLDARGEMVPEGVVGELYVGGAGIARGYLARPEQTAERFVPDPLGEPGSRRYRSGDLATWRHGDLHFHGRVDQQVKVRGYRVELGEIEAVLRAQPGVSEAVVKLVEEAEGRSRLVAYVVPAGEGSVEDEELEAGLQRELPEYMVPAAIVRLLSLPLTPTGKVDRSRLPAPPMPEGVARFVAPRNELEAAVARVWAEVLGVERVGASDNFFKLGGHSLQAMRAATRLRRDLGRELRVRAFFDHPTVEALAGELARAGRIRRSA